MAQSCAELLMKRDWRDDAACLGKDPAWFFPVGESGLGADRRFEAKRVCTTCTVRQQCLDWAMQNGIADGVFGGLDERERRGLRLQHKRRARSARLSG